MRIIVVSIIKGHSYSILNPNDVVEILSELAGNGTSIVNVKASPFATV